MRAAETPPSHPADTPRAALAVCLFSLSFATVLFTLAIFKLLSFFIMPSLFFDLLFIGFPLGAFLGSAFFPAGRVAFLRSLWVLQAITALSVAAILMAKNLAYFDYLRAHLFDVEVAKLLYQMGTFTALFLPFFAAYGLSEYIGYQYGRRLLGGRMRLVYALYLFGAAAAYLFFKLTLTPLGISRMLIVAFGCTALAIAALAGGRMRLAAGLEVALVAVVLVLSGPARGLVGGADLERGFLALYKGGGVNSTREFEDHLSSTIEYQVWGKYSLCEIMTTPARKNWFGFYNDFFQWEYASDHGFADRSLGMVPLLIVEPGARIAIIGAGGGRQVQFAKRVGHTDVVAIEIEPAVIAAVEREEHLAAEFDRVYAGEGVTVVCREARGYMEEDGEPFDLIYLPSVGGYPQMMMEPGNLIRTHEAYATMLRRLTPNGILALWYPVDLDAKSILTRQYVRTLRSYGLDATAYRNAQEILILAARPGGRALPGVASLVVSMTRTDDPRLGAFEPRPELVPSELVVEADPHFTPITDDRPFLAGNVRHILSVRQVFELWGVGGGVLLAAGLVLLFALRRRGDPGIPRRSYWSVAGLTLLIGANFLVMEHALVLALFRRTFVYYDSLMLGAIAFLVLSGLGSILASPRGRLVFSVTGVISTLVLVAFGEQLPAAATLALVAPVALATGTYFPALFDLAARNPLAVFALDAIGAGVGTLLATFIPIVLGFEAFFVLAAVVFIATAAASSLFFRGVEPAAEVSASGA